MVAVPTPTRPTAVPTRRRSLRIGLVLAALLAVGGAVPAVAEIGFDGTGWDAVVVLVAIVSPAIAVATLVLVPLAWHGRRGPAVAVIALQLAAILPAVPPFLHAPGELPASASISAAIGIALNLLAVALVWRGMARRA